MGFDFFNRVQRFPRFRFLASSKLGGPYLKDENLFSIHAQTIMNIPCDIT